MIGSETLTGHSVAGKQECPVCGGFDCTGMPDVEHRSDYPFLPGGFDPMADKDYIIAPYKLIDHERGVIAYGTGERVPIAEAERLGLKVDKRAVKPAENRAHKPAEDRAYKPAAERGRRKGTKT